MDYRTDGIEILFKSSCLNYIVERLVQTKFDVDFNNITQYDIEEFKKYLTYSSKQFEINEINIIEYKRKQLRKQIIKLLHQFAPFLIYITGLNEELKKEFTDIDCFKLIHQNALNKSYPYSDKSLNTPENREFIKKSYLFTYYRKQITDYVERHANRGVKIVQHNKETLMKFIKYPNNQEPFYVQIFDDLYEYFKRLISGKREKIIKLDDRIKNIAKEHVINKLAKMDVNEFIDRYYVWWMNSERTSNELYKIYNDEFDLLNPNSIKKHVETSDQLFKGVGYKSFDKINHLLNTDFGKNIQLELTPKIKNYFPLKQNQKHFQLHTIAPKHSFIIDLMFENKIYCYLIAININTRKLYAVQTNINEDDDMLGQKTTKAYLNALKKIMKLTKIKYLRGDGEKAFSSNDSYDFYDTHGISFVGVERQITKYLKFMIDSNLNMINAIKSEPSHNSLGLIDRVIRTIRDLAFNLHIGLITPDAIKYIVNLYNNAPHKTLSKYAGQLVSPNQVDEDDKLEEFIIRRIQQENYNISSQYGYDIKPGEEVLIYNERNNMAKRRSEIEPETYFINERIGNKYSIKDKSGNVIKEKVKVKERDEKGKFVEQEKEIDRLISRYKLHPKNKSYNFYEFI